MVYASLSKHLCSSFLCLLGHPSFGSKKTGSPSLVLDFGNFGLTKMAVSRRCFSSIIVSWTMFYLILSCGANLCMFLFFIAYIF